MVRTEKGVKGDINNLSVNIGTRNLMTELKIDYKMLDDTANKLESDRKTVFFISQNSNFLGIIAVADIVKENSKLAIKELINMNIALFMLTGDNKKTATHIARQVGIDNVFAELLPSDKVKEINNLRDQGYYVAMVGDGINEAEIDLINKTVMINFLEDVIDINELISIINGLGYNVLIK